MLDSLTTLYHSVAFHPASWLYCLLILWFLIRVDNSVLSAGLGVLVSGLTVTNDNPGLQRRILKSFIDSKIGTSFIRRMIVSPWTPLAPWILNTKKIPLAITEILYKESSVITESDMNLINDRANTINSNRTLESRWWYGSQYISRALNEFNDFLMSMHRGSCNSMFFPVVFAILGLVITPYMLFKGNHIGIMSVFAAVVLLSIIEALFSRMLAGEVTHLAIKAVMKFRHPKEGIEHAVPVPFDNFENLLGVEVSARALSCYADALRNEPSFRECADRIDEGARALGELSDRIRDSQAFAQLMMMLYSAYPIKRMTLRQRMLTTCWYLTHLTDPPLGRQQLQELLEEKEETSANV